MSEENGANMAMARREKHWIELTDAEKIERMRDEVKRLMRIVKAHDRGISLMEDHRHAPDGELMIPLNSRRNMTESDYRRGDDWF